MKTTEVLGRKAHDTITGFKGTITGVAIYLTGCTQYLIEATAEKGDCAKTGWFDDSRIEVKAKSDVLPLNEGVLQGGPQPNAPWR